MPRSNPDSPRTRSRRRLTDAALPAIRRFIAEACHVEASLAARATELHSAFCAWAASATEPPGFRVSANTLGRVLQRLGFARERHAAGKIYVGIAPSAAAPPSMLNRSGRLRHCRACLKAACRRQHGATAGSSELYQAYQAWAHTQEIPAAHVMSHQGFGRAMTAAGARRVRRASGMVVLGIRLREAVSGTGGPQ